MAIKPRKQKYTLSNLTFLVYILLVFISWNSHCRKPLKLYDQDFETFNTKEKSLSNYKSTSQPSTSIPTESNTMKFSKYEPKHINKYSTKKEDSKSTDSNSITTISDSFTNNSSKNDKVYSEHDSSEYDSSEECPSNSISSQIDQHRQLIKSWRQFMDNYSTILYECHAHLWEQISNLNSTNKDQNTSNYQKLFCKAKHYIHNISKTIENLKQSVPYNCNRYSNYKIISSIKEFSKGLNHFDGLYNKVIIKEINYIDKIKNNKSTTTSSNQPQSNSMKESRLQHMSPIANSSSVYTTIKSTKTLKTRLKENENEEINTIYNTVIPLTEHICNIITTLLEKTYKSLKDDETSPEGTKINDPNELITKFKNLNKKITDIKQKKTNNETIYINSLTNELKECTTLMSQFKFKKRKLRIKSRQNVTYRGTSKLKRIRISRR